MSAPELLWVKGNYTGSQPSWKTVLWAVLQLWNGQSACDTANQPSKAQTTQEGERPVNIFKGKAGQHGDGGGDVPPLWYVCLHNGQILMMCEHECSRFAPALSCFRCREGDHGTPLGWAADSGAPWVGTHSATRQQHCAAHRNERGPDPLGPRRRGPTAPAGWAQNAISAADIWLRFGGAATSKSDLIVFDSVIIQHCRLFLLFLGGKDIIIQPHLFNCSNWSQSKWALPFICNGHDWEIVFIMKSLVWWVRAQW